MSSLPTIISFYGHECSEWDGLWIDEACDEFACCKCYQPTPELLAIQDEINVKLDFQRGPA